MSDDERKTAMETYIKKKKFLCTQVADPQSAFSERDTSESWTLLLNKNLCIEKGRTLS